MKLSEQLNVDELSAQARRRAIIYKNDPDNVAGLAAIDGVITHDELVYLGLINVVQTAVLEHAALHGLNSGHICEQVDELLTEMSGYSNPQAKHEEIDGKVANYELTTSQNPVSTSHNS